MKKIKYYQNKKMNLKRIHQAMIKYIIQILLNQVKIKKKENHQFHKIIIIITKKIRLKKGKL